MTAASSTVTAMPERPRRSRLLTSTWEALNVALGLFAYGWIALSFGLAGECEPPGGCDDWATADAVALVVAGLCMAVAAVWRRRHRVLLAVATVLLLVPVFHALFV